MKTNLPFSVRNAWKGSLMLISYFLLAACMQHDENLAPRAPGSDASSELHSEAGGVSTMTKRTFTAHLNSANEVNEDGVDSDGQGQAIFRLNGDGTALHYRLNVANIENVTMAHIHCGAIGINGPFIVWLFEMVPAPGVTVNGTLAEGIITNEDVVSRSCGGETVSTFEDLMEKIREGTAYVNVHTTQYPGGEIRGQIQ